MSIIKNNYLPEKKYSESKKTNDDLMEDLNSDSKDKAKQLKKISPEIFFNMESTSWLIDTISKNQGELHKGPYKGKQLIGLNLEQRYNECIEKFGILSPEITEEFKSINEKIKGLHSVQENIKNNYEKAKSYLNNNCRRVNSVEAMKGTEVNNYFLLIPAVHIFGKLSNQKHTTPFYLKINALNTILEIGAERKFRISLGETYEVASYGVGERGEIKQVNKEKQKLSKPSYEVDMLYYN